MPLPYTFTNETTADADQIQETFEYLDDRVDDLTLDSVDKTAAYTVVADDDVIRGNASGGNFTITLQAGADRAKPVYIAQLNASGGNITVACAGADTITNTGAATYVFSGRGGITLIPHATGYDKF
jgi:hypothetical protein